VDLEKLEVYQEILGMNVFNAGVSINGTIYYFIFFDNADIIVDIYGIDKDNPIGDFHVHNFLFNKIYFFIFRVKRKITNSLVI